MKEPVKVVKEYVDRGFGFPVIIQDVKVAAVGNEEVPQIDYTRLEQALIEALPGKPGRLTGSEVRFIRLHFAMTKTDFGRRFDVTHAGVKRWEDFGDRVTTMQWPIEKDIRLFVCKQLGKKPKDFVALYGELAEKRPGAGKRISISGEKVAAGMTAAIVG